MQEKNRLVTIDETVFLCIRILKVHMLGKNISKSCLVAIFVGWLGISAFAQNLIPNSGFEEIFTQAEYQWVQPQGPFYHYEHTDESTGHEAYDGRYVNGICMYNNEPNEYLHVKLLDTLHAGQTYQLSMQAILMRAKCFKAEEQRYIGVHFGHTRLNTHIPGDLGLKPQVNLTLPDGNRFRWFQLTDTFQAKGGEQYMTIGYFPQTQMLESMSRAQDAFFEDLERNQRAKEANKSDENMSWLYLPPDEQKKYLKEQKKKKKRSGNDRSEPRPQRELMGRNHNPEIVQAGLEAFFKVRYYFDQFCLAPVIPDQAVRCRSMDTPEEIAEGRTINLRNVFFDLDKATLLNESIVQLNALKDLLAEFPKMRIEIRGYTDSQGDEAYNLDLSQRRAGAVVDWLVAQGVDKARLSSKGFGEGEPIDTNETEAGRALNRRVNFYIISM